MKTSLRILRHAITIAGMLSSASLLLSGQTMPPSADTYVSSAFPKLSFGNGIVLIVQSGTTSYVRFNLAALPAGVSVSKATLRLYVDAVA